VGFAALVAAADGVVRDFLGDSAPVLYEPVDGTSFTFRGLFEREFRRLDSTQLGVAYLGPAIFVRLADLAIEPVVGDQVTVAGVVYRIREVQSDGQGAAVLHLQEV
jgi:hypothetical protein